MATTTPNFGWPVPTSTDLVKDGATAIEGLGDAIDASLLDLKGGTTGQVLAKASNTDMDFSWVAQDDSNAIQNAIVDAKGDLIAATANDTPARLAVGTNGQVLTADSTTATGLAWATASGFTYTNWTPTFTNLTVGNGTLVGRYAQSGKLVHAWFKLTFGSTSAVTGNTTITLPVSAASSGGSIRGTGAILDAGVRWFTAAADINGTSQATIVAVGANLNNAYEDYLSSTVPMTWTTNDVLAISFTYEAA
jgi:hypothetical protein